MAENRRDPRNYQIAILTALLVYGVGWLDFEVELGAVAVILIITQLTQLACTRLWRLPRFDPKSALISSLSLCLLLRTDSALLMAATAAVTIASKFVLRWNGKHVFNPTNFGLVAMMAVTGQVWISPGQWGSAALAAFLMACLGGLVVNRASRSDVTWAFLGFYVAMLFGRAWWLGDPLAIPLHQIESGAFLLFAFFMISDPKTTPDSRAGRILFAFLVAFGALFVRFVLYRPNGLLWALVVLAVTVPLIDRILPGSRFRWGGTKPVKGAPHETSLDVLRPAHLRGRIRDLGVGFLRFLRGQGRHQAVQSRLAGGDRSPR